MILILESLFGCGICCFPYFLWKLLVDIVSTKLQRNFCIWMNLLNVELNLLVISYTAYMILYACNLLLAYIIWQLDWK